MRPLLILLCCLCAFLTLPGCGHREPQPPKGPITFNKHIAPLLHEHCASCHRPGQSAPFPLLTFSDAQKHAKEILDVTSRRYMPPWLPDGSMGEFVGDRRLTVGELALLRRWHEDGLQEGNPADLPRPPQFPPDWPLGPPDLIVTLPQPYAMPADGRDTYRNFVVPLGLPERRLVRAVDFRPLSSAVHHALFAFDHKGVGRRWDARDPEPGFGSFTLPPDLELTSHFLGWHPGKQPAEVPRGLAWTLEANSDLVLQLHLRPTGKPETIAPQAAFYFTREAPTNQPLKVIVGSLQISIPPGASNHIVRGTFLLRGDSDVLGVAPHAHLLARQISAQARLPDGTCRPLLHIAEWDFNWQDFYRYKQPVFLPAGTALEMEISYDNSAANPRNPHSPPELVRYGLESADEMAVVGLQILPRNGLAAQQVTQSLIEDIDRNNLEFNAYLLERDPNNSRAHVGLGRALYHLGQLEPAARHLAIARRIDPRDDDAAWLDGVICQLRKQPLEARAAFEECLRLNPGHPRAHGCFAVLALEQEWLDDAELHLNEALRLDPTDSDARGLLREVAKRRARPGR